MRKMKDAASMRIASKSSTFLACGQTANIKTCCFMVKKKGKSERERRKKGDEKQWPGSTVHAYLRMYEHAVMWALQLTGCR